MPLYEFNCSDCGIFDEWRSLAESNAPASCPTCKETARRIFSPPGVLSNSLRLKQENSEPQLVKRDREPQQPRFGSHGGDRPWMIGH
jgi:putative FmdB family regulatory protein